MSGLGTPDKVLKSQSNTQTELGSDRLHPDSHVISIRGRREAPLAPDKKRGLMADHSVSKQKSRAASAAPQPPANTGRPRRSAPLSKRLGRWTLLKPLARGGMGEVYLGCSGGIEGAERPCVVKIIRREHAQDKSFLARFFDEARIQAQLQHPGIAQVLEASTDTSGKPYVVLEHIEGRNLGDVRQRASQLNMPLGWAEVIAIGISVADGLAHVHERTDHSGKALDIVHRDLSPQNIMVGYAGDAKLIDFGTARAENRHSQTVAGIVFAKPGYVAPEVAKQNPGGPQADLYALGIILWELARGRRFLSDDPAEHLARVAAGERNPPPLALHNDIPTEVDTVIARLTAPNLKDRYQAAREAVRDLARVLHKAPSLANGERSVRSRMADLMGRLYPAEPTKTRAEFARLIAEHRKQDHREALLPASPAPAPIDDSILPGTRYRMSKPIAESDMSIVYDAVHLDLERRVALKVLPKERCEDPQFEARFRSEARAIARLRHDNLVTLYNFGVANDGRPFYAMELLQGETLREHLRAGLPEWRRALQIGLQVCAALEVAHARGVVHRDIKPANLFLTQNGGLKVIDFGVAQDLSPDTRAQDGSLSVTGTPDYMAPEQIGDHKVDETADIYALGTVLYEMVTGVLPHVGESTVELLDKKRHVVPLAPRRCAITTNPPAKLDAVLLRALAAKPEERYANTAQFARALLDVLEAPKRQQKRKRRALALSLGAASFGIGFLVFHLQGSERLRAQLDTIVQPIKNRLSGSSAATEPLALTENIASTRRTESAPVDGVGQEERLIYANADHPTAELTTDSPADTTVSLQLAAVPESGALPGQTTKTMGAAAEATNELQPADNVHSTASVGSDDTTQTAAPQPSSAATVDTRKTATLNPTEVETPSDTEPGADLLATLKDTDALTRQGKTARIQALEIYRRLGETHAKEPKVLAGWSRAAAKAKWWGESLRVALRWASLDKSSDAQLHLARTQRLVGQRYGAVQTLERLLDRMPKNQEAMAMLERYRGR